MPAPKEIRNKIASIKKTQKITDAMQKVAASKMRRAQKRMEISMPYANKVREVMQHISASHSDYVHPFLAPREQIKHVGFILISTDRGLCGGLNINLFRQALIAAEEWHNRNIEVDWCLFGSKSEAFFKNLNANVIAQTSHLGEEPQVSDLIGGIKTMLDAYGDNKIDRLFIINNSFISTILQKPQIVQLLPVATPKENNFKYIHHGLQQDKSNGGSQGGEEQALLLGEARELIPSAESKQSNKHLWDYIYEPDPMPLLNTLVVRYIETQVYQAVVDNLACEQVARMMAMKNATDNAEELLRELQLAYNKARQAAITQEIAEIIGGASAV